MAIFSKKKKLDERERDAFADPSPAKLLQLIEMCVAAGEVDKAVDIAERAMILYPNSESVAGACHQIKKMRNQTQIIDLQKTIQGNPAGGHFEMLGSLYYTELHDRDKAYEIAMKGIERFPQSDGLHLIAGLVRMERFHGDYLANDFREAADHFRRAIAGNPMNYKALLSLGRLCAEVGVDDEARQCLEKGRALNPGDPRIDAVLALLPAGAGAGASALDDILAVVEAKRSLDDRGRAVMKIFDPSAGAEKSPDVDAAKVKAFLNDIDPQQGITDAVVLTKGGEIVAMKTGGAEGLQPIAPLIHKLHDISETASMRMDIGGIVFVETEMPSGRICFTCSPSLIFGILSSKDSKQEYLRDAVEKFRATFS